MATRIININNEKGGVGKSTTSMNLGAGLMILGKKVLFIDCDPQSSLTMLIDIDINCKDTKDKCLYNLLTNNSVTAEQSIIKKGNNYIIASTPDLSHIDTDIDSKDFSSQFILRNKLKPLVNSNAFDYIIIDSPPSEEYLNRAAILASTEIVMPIQAEIMPLDASRRFMAYYDSINQQLENMEMPKKYFNGVLITMASPNRASKATVEEIRNNFVSKGFKVFNTVIRRNSKISESPNDNTSVFDYAPTSNGSLDYAEFVKEIVAQEKGEK